MKYPSIKEDTQAAKALSPSATAASSPSSSKLMRRATRAVSTHSAASTNSTGVVWDQAGEITHIGNSSRKMNFEAKKVIRPRTDISASAADVLEEPIVVCRASGTCVVPKNCQRKNNA